MISNSCVEWIVRTNQLVIQPRESLATRGSFLAERMLSAAQPASWLRAHERIGKSARSRSALSTPASYQSSSPGPVASDADVGWSRISVHDGLRRTSQARPGQAAGGCRLRWRQRQVHIAATIDG